jgi:hypothetical protein
MPHRPDSGPEFNLDPGPRKPPRRRNPDRTVRTVAIVGGAVAAILTAIGTVIQSLAAWR